MKPSAIYLTSETSTDTGRFARSVLSAVAKFFRILVRVSDRRLVAEIERELIALENKSDDELEKLGLTRADVTRRVVDDYMKD